MRFQLHFFAGVTHVIKIGVGYMLRFLFCYDQISRLLTHYLMAPRVKKIKTQLPAFFSVIERI